VVISASVLSKAGIILVSRQFRPITRIGIEALLTAFPKLVTADAQHTFIETDRVRYVYQPLEALYVVLVTDLNSNIVEDLDTLRLLAKLVPEICEGISVEAVSNHQFELIFAMDELLSIGFKESVNLQQIKTFMEMDSHEERLQKIIEESKMNEARERAREKAEQIAKQKEDMRKSAAFLKSMGHGPSDFATPYGGASSASSSFGSYQPVPQAERSPSPPTHTASKPSASSKPSKGMQLGKSKTSDVLASSFLKEEKIPEGLRVSTRVGGVASPASQASAVVRDESVTVSIEEQLNCVLERDGTVKKLEVKGEMKLTIYDPDDSKIVVKTNGPLDKAAGWKCMMQPKVNPRAFQSDGSIGLTDKTKGFPVGSDNPVALVRWRMQTDDESQVPFSLNFWPEVEDGQSVVNVEFSLVKQLDLRNVVISIPCRSSQPPEVRQIDGHHHYDHHKKLFTWTIDQISPDNDHGSLEFSVPEVDSESFYPISINFNSDQTYSGFQVTAVTGAESDRSVKFASRSALAVEKYIIE